MQQIGKPILFLLLVVLSIASGVVLFNASTRQEVRSAQNSQIQDTEIYQKVSPEEAAQITGLQIPWPTYLPEGYDLDGIYVYVSESTNPENGGDSGNAQPSRPVEPFQIRYRNEAEEWLILRLYGGDTRNQEVYLNTGGDIPSDFDLLGENIEVNGTDGVLQTHLGEQTLITDSGLIRSRLIWRLPYTSGSYLGLKAIFLSLEYIGEKDDGLSSSALRKVAESIQEPAAR